MAQSASGSSPDSELPDYVADRRRLRRHRPRRPQHCQQPGPAPPARARTPRSPGGSGPAIATAPGCRCSRDRRHPPDHRVARGGLGSSTPPPPPSPAAAAAGAGATRRTTAWLAAGWANRGSPLHHRAGRPCAAVSCLGRQLGCSLVCWIAGARCHCGSRHQSAGFSQPVYSSGPVLPRVDRQQ
jgi:hypothetical protein